MSWIMMATCNGRTMLQLKQRCADCALRPTCFYSTTETYQVKKKSSTNSQVGAGIKISGLCTANEI
jgi:hypothetical protein